MIPAPPTPDAPAPPAATGRVRRAISLALSTLTALLAVAVLAVRIELPETDPHDLTAAATLLRFHERSGDAWILPPIIALLLTIRLPRLGELPALPIVLGWVALGLAVLAVAMARLLEAGPLPW